MAFLDYGFHSLFSEGIFFSFQLVSIPETLSSPEVTYRAGPGGRRRAGLLRPPSHGPFKGKRRRFDLSCTMFCYIAATIWQLRFLCLLLSDRGRNYQSIVSYFRAVRNDALVTAWWKLTYSLMKDTGSKVDRPFIIQSFTADAKFLPWFLRCCFYI